LAIFEFEFGTSSVCFTLFLFRLENRVYLSHGVQVSGAA
jgi:hypothetical protein